MKDLSDNKIFWKAIKPYSSNKRLNSNKMLLKEKGELISNEIELEEVFINITKKFIFKGRPGWPFHYFE